MPAGALNEPCGGRWLAELIRTSPFFDAETYTRSASWARSSDALCRHRRVAGSESVATFDPVFYLEVHRTWLTRHASPAAPLHPGLARRGRRAVPVTNRLSISANRKAGANGGGLSHGPRCWRTGARLEYRRRLAGSYTRGFRIDGWRSVGRRILAAVSAVIVGHGS